MGNGVEKATGLTRAISKITGWLGSFPAILGSALLILLWALVGPIFHYSETWQLVINTGTTIITFLMVFIIQNTQNRDGRAIQAKLDAQSEAIKRLFDALEIDDDDLLIELVGVEEAPEEVIKLDQERVREKASKKGE